MSWAEDPLRRRRNYSDYRDLWTRVQCVYRMYDADGDLLYIGVSHSLVERMRAHRRTTPWFPEVARLSVKLAPSRRAALDTEREAIRREMPRYNRKHSLRLVA